MTIGAWTLQVVPGHFTIMKIHIMKTVQWDSSLFLLQQVVSTTVNRNILPTGMVTNLGGGSKQGLLQIHTNPATLRYWTYAPVEKRASYSLWPIYNTATNCLCKGVHIRYAVNFLDYISGAMIPLTPSLQGRCEDSAKHYTLGKFEVLGRQFSVFTLWKRMKCFGCVHPCSQSQKTTYQCIEREPVKGNH